MALNAPTGDFVTSTLNGACTAIANSMTIGTGLTLPATNGVLQIDYDSATPVGSDNGPETVTYASYNSGTGALTGVVRGKGGTTGVAHGNGAKVQCAPSSEYYTELGAGMSLLPNAPKLINKQDNGSNGTVSNQLVQRGWGYVTGTGSYNHSEKTITLPVAFDDALYDVYVTVIGYKDNSNPTSRVDVAAYATGASVSAQITNASTFVVSVSTAGNIAAATRLVFSWMAVGTKAR